MTDSSAFDRLEQLLEFPVDFPLKIMGRRVDEFAQTISDLILEHTPDFDPASVQLRVSSKGTYLSLTAVVRLHSRAQLEGLYNALSAHPLVRIVL
ncbi:MAG: YbeD family protein [Quisquiliibacterium sp.]